MKFIRTVVIATALALPLSTVIVATPATAAETSSCASAGSRSYNTGVSYKKATTVTSCSTTAGDRTYTKNTVTKTTGSKITVINGKIVRR